MITVSKDDCEKVGRCNCQECAFDSDEELCQKKRAELFMSLAWRNL